MNKKMRHNIMQRRAFRWAKSATVGLALIATPVAMTPALAQDTPKALTCTFKTGTSTTYAKGKFQARRAKPLSFGVADIDLEGQKATLVTTAGGKGNLRVVRAINANHFLEVVTEGFLNITTIYDKDPVTGAWPAVHSRHVGILGQPVVAQYTGFCR
jgi:hypothetical protein